MDAQQDTGGAQHVEKPRKIPFRQRQTPDSDCGWWADRAHGAGEEAEKIQTVQDAVNYIDSHK